MKSVCAIALLAFNLFPTDYLNSKIHLQEEVIRQKDINSISNTVKIGIVATALCKPIFFLRTPCAAVISIVRQSISTSLPETPIKTPNDAADLIQLDEENCTEGFHTATGDGLTTYFYVVDPIHRMSKSRVHLSTHQKKI